MGITRKQNIQVRGSKNTGPREVDMFQTVAMNFRASNEPLRMCRKGGNGKSAKGQGDVRWLFLQKPFARVYSWAGWLGAAGRMTKLRGWAAREGCVPGQVGDAGIM